MPTVDAMARAGTQYSNAWTGMLESITPACHATIGTGMFPKNDGGILGFYWENPKTHIYSEYVNLTDSLTSGAPGGSAAIDPRSLEEIIRASNTPTMAGLLKNADPTSKVYAGSGVKFYAVDAAGGPDADYITYFWNDGASKYRPLNIPGHELPAHYFDDSSLVAWDYTGNHTTMDYVHPGLQDTMVVELASKVIKAERPRMVILNLGEMDYPFGHITGAWLTPKYVRDIMANADRAMKRLQDAYREAGIFHETVFAFLGDHGMVPIAQQVDTSPVHDCAARAGTAVATGPSNLHGGDFHTGGFIWLTDPDRAFKMSYYLDQAKMPAVSAIYFRGQVGGRPQFLPSEETARTINPSVDRAYRYLLETVNGANAPHVALMFEEHTGTLENHGTRTLHVRRHGNLHTQTLPIIWHGDHGGASWESHHIPLVLSGPGIKAGHVSEFPARLVDLAPTFLRLLGVPFPLLDGVVLADAIANPTKSETAGQRSMASLLTPVAAALKRQSYVDVSEIGIVRPLVNPPPHATSKGFTGVGTY
jgi:hypothetical protein